MRRGDDDEDYCHCMPLFLQAFNPHAEAKDVLIPVKTKVRRVRVFSVLKRLFCTGNPTKSKTDLLQGDGELGKLLGCSDDVRASALLRKQLSFI